MSDAQEGFTGWAIVELLGHKKLAGHVSSQAIGGGVLVRVDVPETPGDSAPPTAAYTKLVGVGSIYALTPCEEGLARRAARAIERYNEPLPVHLPALPASVQEAPESDDDGDVERDEDDDWRTDDEDDLDDAPEVSHGL